MHADAQPSSPPAPVIAPVTASAPVAPSPPVAPAVASEAAGTAVPSVQHELVQEALAAIGVSYRRGGDSPESGFDCSGLIVHVYKEALGVSLPHNALAQSRIGRRVDAGDLQPGDLVFYNTRHRRYSHVGLYLGDGRFIHAPKPGAVVRVERMSIGYWSRRFDGARRIDPAHVATR